MLGEIRMFGGKSIPDGWALCQGQKLTVEEYPDLYKALGTTYGGEEGVDFLLPDMQEVGGIVPIHQGVGDDLTRRQMGQVVGVNGYRITPEQAPIHSHQLYAVAAEADTTFPQDAWLAKGGGSVAKRTSTRIYSTVPPDDAMAREALTTYNENTISELNNTMLTRFVNFIIAITDAAETKFLVGEIGIFAYGAAPPLWLACDGQAVLIGDYYRLYTAIGDTFGKNPQDGTFILPNFNTRAPGAPEYQQDLGQGRGFNRSSSVWPAHSHSIFVSYGNSGSQASDDPEGHVLGYARFQGTTDQNVYAEPESANTDRYLNSGTVSTVGDNTIPYNTKNMQPYLGLQFCICYSPVT